MAGLRARTAQRAFHACVRMRVATKDGMNIRSKEAEEFVQVMCAARILSLILTCAA